MNIRNIALATGGLIIGGVAVILVNDLAPCEPHHVKYVVEWNGAQIDPGNVGAFKAALKKSVVFTHHLVISHQQGSNEAPELENVGLGPICLGLGSPNSGLHVTQRVGLNSLEDLKTVESFLGH